MAAPSPCRRVPAVALTVALVAVALWPTAGAHQQEHVDVEELECGLYDDPTRAGPPSLDEAPAVCWARIRFAYHATDGHHLLVEADCSWNATSDWDPGRTTSWDPRQGIDAIGDGEPGRALHEATPVRPTPRCHHAAAEVHFPGEDGG